MILCAVVPEFPVARAIHEWLLAKRAWKQFFEFAERDNVTWTKAHCFFANSGGFVLSFSESCEQLDSDPELKSSSQLDFDANQARTKLENFALDVKKSDSMYGFSGWRVLESNREIASQAITQCIRHGRDLKEPFQKELVPLQGNYWIMNSNQLFFCRKIGLIGTLPDIPEDIINEMGQSDAMIKLFTAAQVSWMILQVIIRASRSLYISQLEISTVAFAVCTIIAYVFWLNKPQNPVLAIPVDCQRKPTTTECISFAELALWRENELQVSILEHINENPLLFWSLGSFGAVIFGSIHFFAWNFSFPTTIERDMWRASSIIMTALPPLGTIFVRFLHFEGFPQDAVDIAGRGVSLLYGCARLLVCIEIFRSLIHLEPGVFMTTWTRNIPHIA